MPRLTFEGNFCDIAMCRENPCPYNGMCSQRETWERLKKYEDAGLEPEEIKSLQTGYAMQYDSLTFLLGKYVSNVTAQHMRDLLQADQDGLMPPCKRGDVVYCIRHNPRTGYYVKPMTVCTVTIWEPGRFSVFTTKEDELGKTVFLTREEAEAALKGGDEHRENRPD